MVFPFDRVHEGSRYRLKDLEKARIFQAIAQSGTITRKEIAGRLGSRPTTVSNIVHQLMRDRLVVEGKARDPGKQGRPEMFLHPNLHRLVAASVYVVSREIKGALIGLDGTILATAAKELPADAGNSLVIETIIDTIERLRDSKPVESELLGVGISLTGSINAAEKRWMYTSRWRNIANIDLTTVEERTGLPVVPNRFVNSRLEYLLMTNTEFNRGGTLLFHWGYGIGAAFALDGRVVQSSSGSFAEVGHWNVIHEEPQPCLCGGTGCLETVSALWALSPRLSERYGEVPEDEGDFAEFFRSCDMTEDPVVERARKNVASSLGNLYMTLYPDRILIYGPFTASKAAYERIEAEVAGAVPPYFRDRLNLQMLPVGFEGDMIGSTHHLFRNELKELLTVDEDH